MPNHILIVEDTDPVRLMFTRLLAQEGYLVTDAPDCEAALLLLEQEAFDLLLADYHLPNMKGSDLIRYVRQQHPAMRTVLMSGDPSVSYLAKDCMADGFYAKGNSLAQLLKAIAAVLPQPIA
jgi:CheY-like chemotaxis protein